MVLNIAHSACRIWWEVSRPRNKGSAKCFRLTMRLRGYGANHNSPPSDLFRFLCICLTLSLSHSHTQPILTILRDKEVSIYCLWKCVMVSSFLRWYTVYKYIYIYIYYFIKPTKSDKICECLMELHIFYHSNISLASCIKRWVSF